MIINKTYDINFKDMEEIILQLAEDIKAGFEIHKIEALHPAITANYWDNQPSYTIYLHNKKADLHR